MIMLKYNKFNYTLNEIFLSAIIDTIDPITGPIRNKNKIINLKSYPVKLISNEISSLKNLIAVFIIRNEITPASKPTKIMFNNIGSLIVLSFAPTNFIVSSSSYFEFRIKLTVLKTK